MGALLIILIGIFLFSFIIYGLTTKLLNLNNHQLLKKTILKAFLFSLLNAPVLCVLGGHSALIFPVPLSMSFAAYLPPELLYSYLPPGMYYEFYGGWASFIVVFAASAFFMSHQNAELKGSD